MSELKVNKIQSTTSGGDCIVKATNNLSNRNLIINGAMNIWQRGTGPYTIAYDYTADRWGRNFTLSGTDYFHIAKSTDSPDGFSSSLKASCGTAQASISATHYAFLRYRMEGQDLQHLKTGTSNAVKTTLSFWAKTNAANSGDTYSVCIMHGDISGNDRFQHRSFTPTSTWQRFTMTFEGQTAISIRNDNDYGLQLFFFLAAGSSKVNDATTTWGTTGEKGVTGQSNFFDSTSNEFFVTGVQFEVGDTATDFEHRTYGDDLAKCQRYYYAHISASDSANSTLGLGMYYSGTRAMMYVKFPVSMRTTPTTEITDVSNGYQLWVGGTYDFVDEFHIDTTNAGSVNGCELESDSEASGTTGYSCYVRRYTADTKQFSFAAEL